MIIVCLFDNSVEEKIGRRRERSVAIETATGECVYVQLTLYTNLCVPFLLSL